IQRHIGFMPHRGFLSLATYAAGHLAASQRHLSPEPCEKALFSNQGRINNKAGFKDILVLCPIGAPSH
ncbi:MAG: hypothetical protein ACO4CH_12605, partial [Saprospiraceae bacterium]